MSALPVPTDEEFRDIGFTGEARNHPRDDFALVLFAAFNGVTVEQLSPAMRYHPNGSTKAAWERVAEAARSCLGLAKPALAPELKGEE